ncbi:hypothetical protein SASPL_107377 [Salvia splendens]|uniref:Uncharacterized protein n=1 Tax=Salvia splendens TaxID=180675 RepID=A0A8X9A5N4_SALSN|nr:hypothetical protein SASPL_107377 [Salvia splendens]
MALRIPLHLLLLIHLIAPIYANSEGDALYALRRAVKDPENVVQSWDPTLHLVSCHLDVGNARLSGKLVPELGKLERLQYLVHEQVDGAELGLLSEESSEP